MKLESKIETKKLRIVDHTSIANSGLLVSLKELIDFVVFMKINTIQKANYHKKKVLQKFPKWLEPLTKAEFSLPIKFSIVYVDGLNSREIEDAISKSAEISFWFGKMFNTTRVTNKSRKSLKGRKFFVIEVKKRSFFEKYL